MKRQWAPTEMRRLHLAPVTVFVDALVRAEWLTEAAAGRTRMGQPQPPPPRVEPRH